MLESTGTICSTCLLKHLQYIVAEGFLVLILLCHRVTLNDTYVDCKLPESKNGCIPHGVCQNECK